MDELYHLASQYWTHEARSVLHQLENGFDLRRFELRNMLGRVPPLPSRLTYGLTRSCSSSWHVTGSAKCEATGTPTGVPPVQLNWDVVAPLYTTTNIYIIYTPNLGLDIAVPGQEREQGRFRGSNEGVTRE